MNEPYSNAESRQPRRLSIVRLARRLAIVDVRATTATLLVCWFEGWTSRIELADGVFLAGGVLASLGAWSLAIQWGLPLGRLPIGGVRGPNRSWPSDRFVVSDTADLATRELPTSASLIIASGILMAGRLAVGAFG